MHAVIFKAEIDTPDKSYSETALIMIKMVIKKYGCRIFP